MYVNIKKDTEENDDEDYDGDDDDDDDCSHTVLETCDTLRPPWSGCCNPWQAWFSRYDMLLM